MKFKLKNDGGFKGLSKVKFPLDVPAEFTTLVGGSGLRVDSEFMVSQGAVIKEYDIGKDSFYYFTSDEFEVTL